MAYYPDWVGIEPESVDFSLFDWIDFAFALPTASFELNWDDDSAAVLLKKIVAAAHKGKTKVKLSIGGWTGSKHFSAAMAESDSRSTFVKNIVSLYKKMGVDGVDIDWEYPGQKGEGNKFSPDDTANYLLFLRALRKALPSKAKITAAVTPEPWVDETGSPAKDLKDFAEVLDWVLIMNYDVNVPPQQFPGPNAPLRDACGNAKRPMASAEGGLKAWKAAGFPANKVALGIAAYGYIHKSDAEKLEMRRRVPRQAQDDGTEGGQDDTSEDDTTTDGSAEDDATDASDTEGDDSDGTGDEDGDGETGGDGDGETDGDSESTDGDGENTDGDTTDDPDSTGGGDGTLSPDEGGTSQIQFNALIKQGALSSSFKGAGEFTRHWDKCSLTPFLTSDGILVSYDDPQSIKMKGAYAKKHGMLGLGMWDIHGDTKDWALMKAAREGLGISNSSGDTDVGDETDDGGAGDDDDADSDEEGTDEDDTTLADDDTARDGGTGEDDSTTTEGATDTGGDSADDQVV
ncbi:glycoside hydrolase [Hymenopellis radicata]|nr:glycoside hydrolase [Hymenopellis radicata]